MGLIIKAKGLVDRSQHLSLTHVNLGGLDLTTEDLSEIVSYIIEKIPNLTHLILSRNQIEYFPDSIGQLSNLIVLMANTNKIVTLPKTFQSLQKLEMLDLFSNSPFVHFPDFLYKCPNLITLNVSNTGIRHLEADIGNLSNLEELDISGTGISKLPQSIGQLLNLISLDARNNGIVDLPVALKDLPNLQKLDFADNSLSDDSINLLNTIEQRKGIDVYYNMVVHDNDQSYEDVLRALYPDETNYQK